MQRYTDYITNQHGDPIFGASVTVFLQGTSNLASLYGDNGVTSKTNPTISDSLGQFWFYAADGRYDLLITGPNQVQQIISDILLEDPLDGSPAFFGNVTADNLTLTNPLSEDNGGTGKSIYTAGQLLIGTTAGDLNTATLTEGDSKIEITNGDGQITIAAPGAAARDANSDITSMAGVTGGIGSPDYITFDTTPETLPVTSQPGHLYWDAVQSALAVSMGNDVILQLGEELYYPQIKNNTASMIVNGTPVMLGGSDGTYSFMVPAIADGSIDPLLYLGLTTENIAAGTVGRVVMFGRANDIDTSMFSYGDSIYISPSSAGTLINTKPASPDYAIFVGFVTKADASSGRIFCRHETLSIASEVGYDNDESGMTASNVQSALDELQLTKASTSMLSSNLTLYATDAASGIAGYYRSVSSIADPDYESSPVNLSFGSITGSAYLLFTEAADANLFTGNPGVLSINQIINVAKTAGVSTNYADFFFQVYQRTSGGVETLVATSGTTGAVNPSDASFYQFTMSALLNNGTWLSTDRFVVKFYANKLAGSGTMTYQIQLGGANPTRTLLPVPVSVLPAFNALGVLVDTVNFNAILGPTDDDVQHALETLDDHTHDTRYYTKAETISEAVKYAIALG